MSFLVTYPLDWEYFKLTEFDSWEMESNLLPKNNKGKAKTKHCSVNSCIRLSNYTIIPGMMTISFHSNEMNEMKWIKCQTCTVILTKVKRCHISLRWAKFSIGTLNQLLSVSSNPDEHPVPPALYSHFPNFMVVWLSDKIMMKTQIK